jgi:repressor of nif and glnA expression
MVLFLRELPTFGGTQLPLTLLIIVITSVIMDLDAKRKLAAILDVISGAGQPMGSGKIADELRRRGIVLKGRMVRYYLEETDKYGFTENLGRLGRRLTELGRKELAAAVAVDRVGFISDFADELAYKMTFSTQTGVGSVIANLSTIPSRKLARAKIIAKEVLDAGLGMGRLLAISVGQNSPLSRREIPTDKAALGTLCSVNLNGVLQANGIPVTSRFGGLLEICDGEKVRFTQIINYDGTTIDPIEIFIKGKMTRVRDIVRTGTGTIGASFREIPAASLTKARQIMGDLERMGLSGVLTIGEPGRPLLDVSVPHYRVGFIVAAGLNPIAALEEEGIQTESFAMDTLCDFQEFSTL